MTHSSDFSNKQLPLDSSKQNGNYTACVMSKLPYFGKTFLGLNYIDIAKKIYA